MINNNHSSGNIGAPFYLGIIVPIVAFGLLGTGELLRRRQRTAAARPGMAEEERRAA